MYDTSTVTAATLQVPDAHLYYEVRGAGPLVVLVGAPMDAAAFAQADLLAVDHTVLTADPRGIHRSSVVDERFWFAHELRPSTYWRPDVAALRAGPTRVVVGVGADSAGEVCARTSAALAAALGIEATRFPGGHTGFVDDPATFVPRLRGVLHGRDS